MSVRHPDEHPLLRRSQRSDRTRKIVNALFERDGEACSYCGRRFTTTKVRPTIDHRVPVSKGGANALSNYVLACRLCNEAKGDMDEAEFRSAPFWIRTTRPRPDLPERQARVTLDQWGDVIRIGRSDKRY